MQWLPQSSGIIVLKYFNEEPLILVLRGKKSFDLPKGHPNPGEDYLTAALRETSEEASITELEFPWGEEFYDTIKTRFFLAITKQDPYIKRNPVTHDFEHESCHWVPISTAFRLLPSWMLPAIIWAEGLYGGWTFGGAAHE